MNRLLSDHLLLARICSAAARKRRSPAAVSIHARAFHSTRRLRASATRGLSALKSMDASAGASTDGTVTDVAVAVQYIVVRRDLWDGLGWPRGSVIAQACHAATAALWLNRDDAVTSTYCENLDSMHKVVLEVKGEAQLTALAAKLEEAGIRHKLWLEQPENIPTCLATKPYMKADVAVFFKKLQLAK